jgi:AAA+ superfamily predicted ATPase
MPNPLKDFFFGTIQPKKDLVEAMAPRRTFDDVIVTEATRRALNNALVQIKKHDLIFHQWGLAERHSSGRGLAFNFAGPPGTGKTICAEAIASALGKNLLVVRYSEMESLWAGETGKNVASVFRAASEQDAVLFFDEADAIAGRRFTSVTQGYQREANTVVNVLLKELEGFDGVVIFATNLAANFDPAFERRIRTHVLFEMPDASTRERIWQVQLHARKTPLAEDVDFKTLAEKYDNVSGGDIKNAVLKAAQMATLEPGEDNAKKIHQRHFEDGMKDVVAAKKVMDQNIFNDGDGSHSSAAQMSGMHGAVTQLAQNQEELEGGFDAVASRLDELEESAMALPSHFERIDETIKNAHNAMREDFAAQLGALSDALREEKAALEARLNAAHEIAEGASRKAEAAGKAAADVAQKLEEIERAGETRHAEITTQLRENAENIDTLQTLSQRYSRYLLLTIIGTVTILAATLILVLR